MIGERFELVIYLLSQVFIDFSTNLFTILVLDNVRAVFFA